MVGLSGCGAESKSSQPTAQPTVSLWSAVTTGDYRQVNDGAKLALAEHGGKAGPFRVNYAAREVSDAEPQMTEDALVAARMTLQDTQSSVMIARADDMATGAAITLLNQAGIGTVALGDDALKARVCSPRDELYPNGRATAIVIAPGAAVPAGFRQRFRHAYGYAPDALAHRSYLGAQAVLKSLAAPSVATDDTPKRLNRDALAAELVRAHGDCG